MKGNLFLVAICLCSALPFVHASTFSDCSVYGNCQPVRSGGTTFNNASGQVNNSFYWNGLTTSNLSSYVPYVGANRNVNLGNFNFTVNTSLFHVDSTTNRIGIGIITPDAKLHVNGNLKREGLPISAVFTDYLDTSEGLFIGHNSTSDFGYIAVSDLGQAWQSLVLQPTSGNVGIGEISPSTKLDINGNLNVDAGDISLDSGESLLWGVGNDQINFDGTAFRHLVGGAVRMRLTTTGLMIGQDSNPSRALDVRGLGNFSGELYVQNGTAVSPWLYNQTFDTTNLTASYVPYVGAGKNVNLGNKNATLNNLFFSDSLISNSGNISKLSTANSSIIVGFTNNGTGGYNRTATLFLPNPGGGLIVGRAQTSLDNSSAVISGNEGASSPSYIFGTVAIASSATNSRASIVDNSGAGLYFGQVDSIRANFTGFLGSSTSSALGTMVIGRVTSGGTLNVNGSLDAAGSGNFVQGYVQGGSIRTSLAGADGAMARGATFTSTAVIDSSGDGSTAQGTIQSGGILGFIIASGFGSIASGSIQTARGYIHASGEGSTAIGLNVSATNTRTIALGQNVNVSGLNSFGIGLGSTTTKIVSQSNIFVVNDGDFYLNGTTNPSIRLGKTQESQIYVDSATGNTVANPKVTGAGAFQILGTLQLNQTTGGACNIGTAGQIYWNSTTFKHYGCNSTNWYAMDSSGAFY